jgi:hypothetical protein
MSNPNPSYQFKKGNQIAKLGKGVPKPTLQRNFHTIVKNVINHYEDGTLVEYLQSLDKERQLYFYMEMLKIDKDHTEKMLRLEFDRQKLTPLDPSENNIIIIKGPENEEELDGM